MDPGESHREAAIRELREETGLVVDDVGAKVWSEEIDLPYDEAIYPGAYQEYFLVTVNQSFEPDQTGWTDSERVDVTASRWWSVEELESTEEPFEPRALPSLVRTLLGQEEH